MKKLSFLVCFFMSVANAGELSGFGFASVIENGNNQILEVGDSENTFRIRLDEKTYKKEIAALDINADAKRKALDVGKRFFQTFQTQQRNVENYLVESWTVRLDEYSLGGQKKLLSPDGCDKLKLSMPENLFKSVAFELPPEAMKVFSNRISSFSGGNELVVVDIEEVRKRDQGGLLGKASLEKVIAAFKENETKTALKLVQLEIADSMSTHPENLYIMTKKAADSFQIPYDRTFSEIKISNIDLLSPTLEFNTSKLKLLEGFEYDQVSGLQAYIDRNTNVVDRYKDDGSRGQIVKEANLPNLRDIKFYSDGDVEVRGLVNGGIKDDVEDVFDINSYYGQTGITGEVNGLSLSVVTQFEAQRIQAKGIQAEYKVASPRENIDLNFNWGLTNKSEDDFLPSFNSREMGTNAGFMLNIKF